MDNDTNAHNGSQDTDESGKGIWFYLKIKGLFLIVTVVLVGLTGLLFFLLGWKEPLALLVNANVSEGMIDVLVILVLFLILFGNNLSLPLTIGFTAIALVPVSFHVVPKILRGTFHPWLVTGFVIIEFISMMITFRIKIWIWEEEEIQPPF